MKEAPKPASTSLPALRDDLQLLDGPAQVDGSPSWLIYDALGHRYIKLDQATYQLLALWPSHTTAESLAAAASHALGRAMDLGEIKSFIGFLHQNNLARSPPQGGWQHYAQSAAAKKHGWSSWLLHNYLFLAVPLVRPERFLRSTMPLVAPMLSRTAAFILLAVGGLSLYLVSRQWDGFYATFQHFYGLEGAVAFGAVLLATKIFHELGHAYAATKFGCSVPTMGVAFMLLAPMPYADVTDAWKLKERWQRILVDSAGILAELALAVLATFLWVFLPDGTLRSAAFAVACVGWVISLGINLNPFARFDGYYLLSDLVQVDNLQTRSFALARWRIREILFALGVACPEQLPRGKVNFLIIYAWATWIYRFLLFIGIAILVYVTTFKLLGILLFAVEIAVFVAKPIFEEMAQWWSMRKQILAGRRWRLTAAGLATAFMLTAVPWSTHVSAPAIVEAAEVTRLFPLRPADVLAVHVAEGERVEANTLLVSLTSPQLELDIRLAEVGIKLVRLRRARTAADLVDRTESLVLDRELTLLSTKLEGLHRERDELSIRAPTAGIVVDLNPALHAGRAIGRSEPIAILISGSSHVVRGYILESDVERIRTGVAGRFVTHVAPKTPLQVSVSDITGVGASTIDLPELTTRFGGTISIQAKDRRTLSPVAAWYPITMTVTGPIYELTQRHRGVVILEGRSESLLICTFSQIARVVIRESGF